MHYGERSPFVHCLNYKCSLAPTVKHRYSDDVRWPPIHTSSYENLEGPERPWSMPIMNKKSKIDVKSVGDRGHHVYDSMDAPSPAHS